jgi:pimeloyl-ACP methyl ester carboxylesterase
MATIDRDGVHIHYGVVGGGPGTPVLLTHGFRGTSRIFTTTVAALAPSRTCLTWDVRGHGQSDYPDDLGCYTVPLTLGDMLAVLDAAAVERAVLVGHSMGGFLSLELQRQHPARVAALVLADTGPGYRNAEGRAGWNDVCESFAVALETEGPDGLPAGEDVQASTHRNVDGLVQGGAGDPSATRRRRPRAPARHRRPDAGRRGRAGRPVRRRRLVHGGQDPRRPAARHRRGRARPDDHPPGPVRCRRREVRRGGRRRRVARAPDGGS